MSLPAPYTPPHHRMRLPVPAWLPQRFLHHHQKWPRTSPYPWATSRRYGPTNPPAIELSLDIVQMHVVKMIGIKLKHMVCLLQAELNTDGYLCAMVWVKEWEKNSSCDLHVEGQRCKWKMRECLYAYVCSLLSCLVTPCLWYLTVTSWVVSSSAACTMCSRSEAAHTAGALFACVHFKISQSSQIGFLNSYSHFLIHAERVRRWSCLTDKDTSRILKKNSRADSLPGVGSHICRALVGLSTLILACCYGDRHWVTYKLTHVTRSLDVIGRSYCSFL